MEERIRQVQKRDGRVVPFDASRIAAAVLRAAEEAGQPDRFLAEEVAALVSVQLARRGPPVPGVEEVEESVLFTLLEAGLSDVAARFKSRRAERRRLEEILLEVEDQPRGLLSGAGGLGRPAGEEPARAARPRESLAGLPPWIGGDLVLGSKEPAVGTGEPLPELAGGGSESSTSGLRPLRRWSKAEVIQLLVHVEGLDEIEAAAVARSVEARLLRSGLVRCPEGVLVALIRGELFERGRMSRLGASGPNDPLATLAEDALRGGLGDRRARQPAGWVEGLGERVLEAHLLRSVLETPVAEAHRLGDLHVYDLGAPLRLAAVSLSAAAVADSVPLGECFDSTSAPERARAALESVLLSQSSAVARLVTIEDIDVFLAPFMADLSDEALGEAIRSLLLSPVLHALPDRGGLLAIELGIAGGVPSHLAGRAAPHPAPKGRRLEDYGDAAWRLARALLEESALLRRQGRWVRAGLSLRLPTGRLPDAALRSLLRAAARSATEAGEPQFHLEDERRSVRGGRLLRLDEDLFPDPLHFALGDLTVGAVVAVNLAAAALRSRRRGLKAFIEEGCALADLAVRGLDVRRRLLARASSDHAPLLAGAQGQVPFPDVDGCYWLVEWVGLDQALALLEPRPRARKGLRQRIVADLAAALDHLAAGRGLTGVHGVEERLEEASARFARADAARFSEAEAWWPEGAPRTYRRCEGVRSGTIREPLGPDPRAPGGTRLRLRWRIDADAPPALDALLEGLEIARRDPSLGEIVLDPWPRRLRQPAGAPI